MPATKKNQFWKLRTTHGRDKIFESPALLEAACYEYFEAVETNPLKEEKAFSTGNKTTLNRMRAFTLKGLFIFLDINRQTWENYKAREDFLAITEKIETIIYTQKFEGAAAGLLKENIIARELGLADKSSLEIDDLNDQALDKLYNRVMKNVRP